MTRPAGRRRVLFVCTGNICRSALAERIFRRLLAEAGLDAEVRSAGVAAYPGMTSPKEVLQALAARGLDGTGHRAQPLSGELVDWADLILTMESGHQMVVAGQFPRTVGKIHVLKDYVDLRGDVEDPIGRPQKDYDACADEIEELLKKLLEKLKIGSGA